MLTQHDITTIEEILDEKIGAKTKLLPTKEEFFDRMDTLSGEIKTMRESFDLHAGQHDDINNNLENYEKRLKRIETHLHLPVTS